jgi:hypothetical protein
MPALLFPLPKTLCYFMQEKEDIWQTGRLKDIPDHVLDYLKTKFELYKVIFIEQISQAASNIVLGVLLFLIGLFTLIFLSITLALVIGKALDETYLGFLIVSCIYIIAGIILFTMKKKLILEPITNMIIQKVFDNDGKKDDKNK